MDKETVFCDSKARVQDDEPQELSSINSPPVHHSLYSQARTRCGQNSVQLPSADAHRCSLHLENTPAAPRGGRNRLCCAQCAMQKNLNPIPKNVTYVGICMFLFGGNMLKNLLCGFRKLGRGLNFVGFFEMFVCTNIQKSCYKGCCKFVSQQ